MRKPVQAETAFLEAFHAHSDALFRHALYRLSDRDRALDAVQDTFLKTWDFIRGGGEVKSFKSFLYRVLHNLIIDEYRKSRPDSLDVLLEEAPSVIEKELSSGNVLEIEAMMDEKELRERVKNAVLLLDAPYQAVVALRFIDGLMPREIAGILGVTENIVSVRIHRGVAKLKELCKKNEI